jgi:hypothetical protein
MRQTVVGSSFPIGQVEVWDYDPVRGWLYRAHIEGRDQQLMSALQNDYVAQGIANRLTFELGKGVLDIEDATQQWVLDNWQLEGNSEQVAWLSNSLVQQELNSVYPTAVNDNTVTAAQAIAAIAQHLSDGDNQDTAFSDGVLDPLTTGDIWNFYPHAQAGQTAYENDADGSGYVLRHGTNVSNQWTVNVADFGVGQIYTTAQLLSEVSDGGLWLNPLSFRMQYKIANLPVPPARAGWIVGWKKGRSTEQNAANNRNDITTHYEYGQWTTCLYQPFNGIYGGGDF